MNVGPDLERLVSDWLRTEATAAGSDRVLAAALDRVTRTGQAVDGPGWGLPDRAWFAAAAASALVVVAVVALTLLPSFGVVGVMSPTRPSAALSPASTASPRVPAELRPGDHIIQAPYALVHLTVPSGWTSAPDGTVICRVVDGLGCPETNGPQLALHDVIRVVTDTCPGWPENGSYFEAVGPTVDHLTTALVNQVGPHDSTGPTDVALDGYPGKKFVMTYDQGAPCGGPEGRHLWENANGSHFGLLKGGTAMVWLVDVNGERVVITSHDRGSQAEDVTQLDAVIASIDIEPRAGGLPVGPHTLTLEGLPVSLEVPSSGWQPFGDRWIDKSSAASHGAEAIIRMGTFPDGVYADPCAGSQSRLVGPSAAELAAAVSTAPGIELVSGPDDATVGGRPAKHLVVIPHDVGCEPRFDSLPDRARGSFWNYTRLGDRIKIWIVDVDGRRLFIAGERRPGADTALDQEIDRIVESIAFE